MRDRFALLITTNSVPGASVLIETQGTVRTFVRP